MIINNNNRNHNTSNDNHNNNAIMTPSRFYNLPRHLIRNPPNKKPPLGGKKYFATINLDGGEKILFTINLAGNSIIITYL